MTIFEENEALKEIFVLEYGAWEAKSIYFEKGVPIIPEPFLETTVRWEKDADEELIKKAMKDVNEFKDRVEKRCFVTDVQNETVYGHPQIIWGIFKDEENIFGNNEIKQG